MTNNSFKVILRLKFRNIVRDNLVIFFLARKHASPSKLYILRLKADFDHWCYFDHP